MSEEDNFKNVAKYVIRNTPIGHLGKALENLKAVVGGKIMDSDDIKKEIHDYGETHLTQVPVDKADRKVVISNLTKTPEGRYQDQLQQVQFRIGLETGAVEEVSHIDVQHPFRDLVAKKLKVYIDKYYKPEVTKYNVYYDSTQNKIIILISAHNINLKNYWSGEWLSSWEYGIETKKLTGKLKADTYYYEEGDIQFLLNQTFDDNVQGANEEQLSDYILYLIENHENNVHLNLDKVYEEFTDFYIKPLRRTLPITGTRMNWTVTQVNFGS